MHGPGALKPAHSWLAATTTSLGCHTSGLKRETPQAVTMRKKQWITYNEVVSVVHG